MADIGLKIPFQFAPQGTLATSENADLVRGHVEQVVNVRAGDESGSQRGEYKWLTEFGNIMDLARHHSPEIFEDLIETFVDDALARWVPSATFHAVEVFRDGRLRQRARIAWTYRKEGDVRLAQADLT